MTSLGDFAWRLRLPEPIHQAGKTTATRFGAMTGSLRAMPEFVIIGAQRCGTTSLSRYLGAHPQVVSSTHKEIHYFDLNYERSDGWYRGHFPTRRYRRLVARRRGTCISGEASPYYMFHPLAAERLARTLPDAKLIVMLRDPVERAISHYHHSLRRGKERLGLREALDREAERLAGEEERIICDPTYNSEPHRYFSYVARGLYAPQLERWFAVVPRERICVVESRRFLTDPGSEFGRVQDFLGLTRRPLGDATRHNAKPYGEADPEIVERLRSTFRRHDRAVYELVGDDFAWARG
jgi:Sulfotransferase domain